jgi:hypothetical protein
MNQSMSEINDCWFYCLTIDVAGARRRPARWSGWGVWEWQGSKTIVITTRMTRKYFSPDSGHVTTPLYTKCSYSRTLGITIPIAVRTRTQTICFTTLRNGEISSKIDLQIFLTKHSANTAPSRHSSSATMTRCGRLCRVSLSHVTIRPSY